VEFEYWLDACPLLKGLIEYVDVMEGAIGWLEAK
jgi:hypothetical protein